MHANVSQAPVISDDAQLLADEAKFSSFGDTVHYVDPPKIFRRCEGSFLYDSAEMPYLDLQMWYSAVNFGYANKRLNEVLKRQKRMGLVLEVGGWYKNVITLAPSLNITREETDMALSLLDQLITKAKRT
jgi:4-aminobutyrate aminotransferase-like enzyme